MKPIQLPSQTPEQPAALDGLYRTTKDVRLRQRVQVILLAAESLSRQKLTGRCIG